jgi:hypothetical protein
LLQEKAMNLEGENDGSQSLVPESLVRDQLRRMLQSTLFSRSPRVGKLFQYLVDRALAGRVSEITETQIGQDVYDDVDFDPTVNAKVRVAMGDLRAKLREYYDESSGDPVRISAPKGHGYGLLFAVGSLSQQVKKNDTAAIVGTWISEDFPFKGDVIKATFEFKSYGPVIAGSLHHTLSNKNALNIQGGIADVKIEGDHVDFTIMMDVWGMHTSRQFPLRCAGVLSGDRLSLAALWDAGPAEFTARRVAALRVDFER